MFGPSRRPVEEPSWGHVSASPYPFRSPIPYGLPLSWIGEAQKKTRLWRKGRSLEHRCSVRIVVNETNIDETNG